MLLSQLASLLDLPYSGEDVEICAAAGLEDAAEGQLSFLANRKYTAKVHATRASAVIIPQDLGDLSISHIRSPNPYLTFALALEALYPLKPREVGIHPTAVLPPSATLGTDPFIGANSVIGEGCRLGDRVTIHANCTLYPGVRLGDDCVLHSNVSIREDCVLGKRVILQNGACIGSDGFGYARLEKGGWHKLRQTGRVIIEDDVEIGANATVDRATIGETLIRRGSKIDNLVQIGHACTVGEDSLLCAQVGLAGSSHVGRQVILAGQVGVAGHLEIGDGAQATAQTGIPGSVPAGQVVSGYPAVENREWLRQVAELKRLPGLRALVQELRERLSKLETRS
ncbi:MAG: UDP-3-O-(3-hydroxymyristoyl)glucosamine N-acyltransferase [Acidobacteria bacterium]|nr:UDP-3-O-(3-hydroxymyristoyl)glucosamine N-acyltransferase [Acidobacteriota bacterium]